MPPLRGGYPDSDCLSRVDTDHCAQGSASREGGRESVAPPSATFPSEQSDEIEFSLNRNGFLRMSKREGARGHDIDACPNLHEKRTVDS